MGLLESKWNVKLKLGKEWKQNNRKQKKRNLTNVKSETNGIEIRVLGRIKPNDDSWTDQKKNNNNANPW